jgi:hypothetical protein
MSTFSLASIRRTRSDMPPRTIVYGAHKIGKSTFANGAPGAIVIQTEDGMDAIDGAAFPLCKSWEDVLACVTALYQEQHEHKTVVLDSVDWAERLAQAAVCADQGVKSIEMIGYGKGYAFAADKFAELLDGMNALRTQRGMHVVLLCHSEIRRFDDPLADSYDRYQLKLHKQTAKLVQEWADVIGYAALDAVTKVEKEQGFKPARTRALTTGRRVLHLQGSPAFEAGNRYGLQASVPLEWAAYQAALDEARAPQKGAV